MSIRFGRQEGRLVHTDGLGPLQLFGPSLNDESARERETSALGVSRSPQDVVRILARHVCHRPENLVEGKYKPGDATLSRAEVAQLTIKDIETIADAYIEERPSISQNSIFDIVEEEGRQIRRHRYGDPKLSKLPNEPSAAYLVRLLELHDTEIRTHLKETLGQLSSFSGAVQSTIASTYLAGESLMNSFLPPAQHWMREPIGATRPDRLVLPVRAADTTNQLLSELGAKLGDLIEHSQSAAEYAVEANNTQITIAHAVNKGIADGSKFSKITIGLSFLVFVLTVASLMIAAYSMRQTSRLAAAQSISHREDVQRIDRYLASLEKLESEQRDILRKLASSATTSHGQLLGTNEPSRSDSTGAPLHDPPLRQR